MSQTEIELSIVEPLGNKRTAWPVTMGVPFPQGILAAAEDLRLRRKGDARPLQTRTMMCWPDGSVRWVLLDFQADLGPGENHRLTLSWAPSQEQRPRPATPVGMRETMDGTVFIETGDNQWAIAPSGTMPFARAYLGDREVVPDDGLQSSVRVDGETYELRVGSHPVIEEEGPLRVVVRVDGIALGDDGSSGFDVTARIYAYAGCSWLRIYLTLTNRIRRTLVHLEEFKVSLAPALDGGTAHEHAFLVASVDVGNHESHVDDLIGDYRSLRVGLVDMPFPAWQPGESGAHPTSGSTPEQPRRADPQYEILPGTQGAESDRRPGASWCNLVPAAAVMGDDETTVSLQCRRFWHQAPKEMALTPRRAQLSLYADWAEPLEFFRGVAKTHELIVDIAAGKPRRDPRTAFALGFEKQPSFQVATRNWMIDSGAFGPLFRYQPEKYRWWEYILRQALQSHTFNVEHEATMGFHFLNYGDFWNPGRGGQWKNNEMDKGFGLMLQMIRTGEGLVWEHVEPIIHHQIDVDTVHDDDNEHWIGAQRYHFAKHGAIHGPTMCHEWIDGPLFFGLLAGYRRAEEVAGARADHFVKAIELGEHRIKTLTRVAGYPLMALSRMYENYRDERYLRTCERIMDWLDEWSTQDGHYTYNAYTPPGKTQIATSLSDGILMCALMRHHLVTDSPRSWQLLQETADRDFDVTGLIRPEGFTTKGTSPFRNYYEPEPDFWFEPMMFLTLKSGEPRYADVGFAELQRIFAQRRMLAGDGQNPPHFYRYWLPSLARADELGMLRDPQPLGM
ncbi:MAG: hypothetical protein O2782_14605 [bacterium]|nr:hypothetical protein [bacterium]